MKIVEKLSLFTMVALLVVSCNKEDMDKPQTKVGNSENTVAPQPTDEGRIVDENGVLMRPSMMLPEDYAAMEMTKADVEYTIPVVFHIFGNSQGSGTLNAARIEKVLTWINNDFNGIKNPGDTEYFGSIEESRKEFVDNLPIKFVLAKCSKDGVALKDGQKVYGGKVLEADVANSGTISGDVAVIIYSKTHPLPKKGIGYNSIATNNEMKKIAWDNKMYMNVYITNDLFADGWTNNSGIAWYPDTYMTNQNVARVVYNGAYLPGGTYPDKDFTSIISHEFGHYLGLAHTFNEGDLDVCRKDLVDGGVYGDGVADTPQMENSSGTESNGWKQNTAYWGHGKKNCNGEIIDFGNFMNYGVYCNFTKGQVVRMKGSLNDLYVNEKNEKQIARKSLWQPSNLEKVLGPGKVIVKDPATFKEKLDALNK